MDIKEYEKKKQKRGEQYRISKFYIAAKQRRIKISEAIKELQSIGSSLKFEESKSLLAEIIQKLEKFSG